MCLVCGERTITRKCSCGFDESKNYDMYRTLIPIHNTLMSCYKQRKNFEKKLVEAAIQNYLKENSITGDGENKNHTTITSHLPQEKYDEFAKWIEKANANDKEAMIKIAEMYRKGDGTEPDIRKAIDYYQNAARLNDTEAMFQLGTIYFDGEEMKRNYLEAFKWYEQGAKKGNRSCMERLGYMFEKGLGTYMNQTIAKQWYENAAKIGMKRN